MTKKILIIFASTAWMTTGCGSDTTHESIQKATNTVVDTTKDTVSKATDVVHKKAVETMEKVQENIHAREADEDNGTKGKSLMDKVADAAKKAKESASSAMATVKETTSKAVEVTQSAVKSVKQKADEAVEKVKENLKGSAPDAQGDTNKTLFDRITDVVHNAEETTQSLGTTAKVVNTVRKTLGD